MGILLACKAATPEWPTAACGGSGAEWNASNPRHRLLPHRNTTSSHPPGQRIGFDSGVPPSSALTALRLLALDVPLTSTLVTPFGTGWSLYPGGHSAENPDTIAVSVGTDPCVCPKGRVL